MAGESAGQSARRMREKSERLVRAAELWERGAEGERATAAVLAALPTDEWTVFHDLRWPGRSRANLDHVVVGPPGVFVIDSKNWSGTIQVRGGVLRQDGRLREPAVTGAIDAARAVARQTSTVSSTHILPVLCFVRDEPVMGRARDAYVCSNGNLLEFLQSRPRVLTAEMRMGVCRELHALSQSPPSPGMRFARTQQTARSPRRLRPGPRPTSRSRRRGIVSKELRKLAGFLATVGMMLAVLTTDLPHHVADAFISVVTPDAPADSPITDRKKRQDRGPDKARREQRERPDSR